MRLDVLEINCLSVRPGASPELLPRQMLAGVQGRRVLGPAPSSASAPGDSKKREARGWWALPHLAPASLLSQQYGHRVLPLL